LHEYRVLVTLFSMIISFRDRVTADLYHGITNSRVKRLPPKLVEFALYKPDILNAAQIIDDLRSPSGNRLESLKGEFSGFYSIRINSQWRIVLKWQASNAYDVIIVDYH